MGYTCKIWNDRIDWRAQLNVENVLNNQTVIVIDADTTRDHFFRFVNPTTFSIPNSFRF